MALKQVVTTLRKTGSVRITKMMLGGRIRERSILIVTVINRPGASALRGVLVILTLKTSNYIMTICSTGEKLLQESDRNIRWPIRATQKN